ncbi:signal recognition particle subunit [Lecanora helva]
MAQHARIEELSDTDSDPPEDDIDTHIPSLIRPSDIPAPTGVPASQFAERSQTHQSQPPRQQPAQSPFQSSGPPPEYKHYQTLYPLYFDAVRTRSEGRRVGVEHAVPNPLAREIVDAVQMLGLKTVFEPGKMHPKDWSNPGRVRVLVKEGGLARSGRVKNKSHLYILVSNYLKAHPATAESPLRLKIQGMPPPSRPIPPPAAPRGWKMNSILPLHSAALSGGGVSDNILKDVMQEMQGAAQGGGIPGMPPGMPGLGALGGGGQGSADGSASGGKRRREGAGKKK